MALTRSRFKPGAARRKTRRPAPRRRAPAHLIPPDANEAEVAVDGHRLRLTHLRKPFWPELGLTKGDLLAYYAAVAPYLLPHLQDRALVMKRYPNGATGKFFFQKRAPEPHPDWLELCSIAHPAAGEIDFPVVRDRATLLWIVNLGCIDLHPWYARCDDVHRPDYLHFDLDPVEGADFGRVRDTALLLHRALDGLEIPNYAKTTGSRGIHVYVPIVRGPTQKEVWTFAKQMAQGLERLHPELVTAEYRIARRPKGRVLVDYNQNAWGRTLASVYSVRPTAMAGVSTPVTWEEIQRGFRIEDFRLQTVPQRLRDNGDLWRSLLQARGRFNLARLF